MDSKARRVVNHVNTALGNVWNAAEHIRYNKHIPNKDIQKLLKIYNELIVLRDDLEHKYFDVIA